MRVRVLSWNVWGFRRGVAGAVEVVRRADPDLVLLQETGRRSRLAAFARTLGLHAIAEPSAILHRRVRNAICVGRGWAIDRARTERFRGDRWAPRGAVIADLHRGDARLRVIATHLGLRPDERLGQARRLLELAEVPEGSVVIGGDLNVGPDRDAAGLLAGRLVDVWGARPNGLTYPADSPSARIDYVFVTDAIGVHRSHVASTDASDHLALVTELELPD